MKDPTTAEKVGWCIVGAAAIFGFASLAMVFAGIALDDASTEWLTITLLLAICFFLVAILFKPRRTPSLEYLRKQWWWFVCLGNGIAIPLMPSLWLKVAIVFIIFGCGWAWVRPRSAEDSTSTKNHRH